MKQKVKHLIDLAKFHLGCAKWQEEYLYKSHNMVHREQLNYHKQKANHYYKEAKKLCQ